MSKVIKSHFGPLEVPEVPIHRFMFMRYAELGDKIAMTDAITEKEYSYNDIISTSQKIASGLVKLGVRKGDVVAMYSYNTPEWVMMYWGIVCTGAIATTVNPQYTKYELVQHLKDCGATYLYTVKELVQKSKEAVQEIPEVKNIITLRSTDPACFPYEMLAQDDGSRWSELEEIKFDVKEDVVVIPYSSGTTGFPKGVMLTHYNILANFMQVGHPDIIGPAMVDATQQGKINKAVFFLPFYHVAGLIVMLTINMGAGVQLIILPKFEPRLFLSTIEKYKVNLLTLVPPVVIFMAKSPMVKEYDISSVERAMCGAAPLSMEMEEEFKAKLNIADMKQGFGMTEATALVLLYAYNTPIRTGSSGVLLPGTEAMIVDPSTGETLGPNQRGELWLRGPQIMKGYLNKPEQTRETIDADKWLHTGDIAYFDEDEYWYIVDRIKELIKVKGLQVAPTELEALLLSHPKVADVGVVGIPDERAGELPRAYIVRKPNMEVTEKELYDYAAERTAPFKYLKGGIHFISEIPKLPSGKILRRKLKELVIKSKI